MFENRNTFDFRFTTVNGSDVLTFIMGPDRRLANNPNGGGIILNTSYQVLDAVNLTQTETGLDIHEFQVMNGNTSLSTCQQPLAVDVSSLGFPSTTASILDTGFREIELSTGKVLFEWWPSDHLSFSESMLVPPRFIGINSKYDCW